MRRLVVLLFLVGCGGSANETGEVIHCAKGQIAVTSGAIGDICAWTCSDDSECGTYNRCVQLYDPATGQYTDPRVCDTFPH